MYIMCLIIIEMRQFPIHRSIRIHIDLLIGQCPSLYIAAIVFRYSNIQRIMKSMKYPSDVHYTSVISCRSFNVHYGVYIKTLVLFRQNYRMEL